MTDIDDRLRSELERATDLGAPRVDVGGLARAGRRERTRRRGLLTSAAVVVAVVLSGTFLTVVDGGRGSTPQPAPAPTEEPGDLGRPSAAPWWGDGVVHAAGTEVVAGAPIFIRYANGTTLAEVRDDDSGWRLVALRDGTATELARGRGPSSARRSFPPGIVMIGLSADGTVAAWLDRVTSTTRTVVAYDLVRGRRLDTLTIGVEFGATFGGPGILSVDDEGRVVWAGPGREVNVWRPGGQPQPVTGIPDSYLAFGPSAWPGGLTYQGAGRGDVGVYGSIDAQGRFTPVGRTATDYGGAWSPGGRRFAYPGDAQGRRSEPGTGRLWVQGPGLDPFRVPLPASLVGVVGWESSTEVLVEVAGPSAHTQVRCEVVERECAEVVDPPPDDAFTTVAGRGPG